MKLCECGCSRPAPIASVTNSSRGWRKGKPLRFISGHNTSVLTHGMSETPEYYAYKNAKQRCSNKNRPDYIYYGGRGIEFRFRSFEEFFAELGPRPSPKHSLDRINNSGHYEPGNLRWTTQREQRLNSRRPTENRKQTL